MKKNFFFLTVLCFIRLLVIAQSNIFSIAGKIINFKDTDFIYLLKGEYPNSDKFKWNILDSTSPKNGKFYFKLNLKTPNFYLLVIKGNRWCTFIAEPNKRININGNANDFLNADVKGTLSNNIYKGLIKKQNPLVKKMNIYADSADIASGKIDSISYLKYLRLNQKMASRIKLLNIEIINKYSTDFYALYLMQYYYNIFSDKRVLFFLQNLPAKLKNHPLAKDIYYNKFQKQLELKKISKFYDFKLYDTLNEPINFNNYYGNIILIDFWASWCKPCIANIPIINKIYEKYKKSNFKILSVSMDETLENWKKGLSVTPTQWMNASDLKGWQSIATKYYKIESIPRYMLLNVDGSLISSDIKIEELDNIISKHLNETQK